MKQQRGYHFLFGLSLVALGVLGSWWVIFFIRSVDLERSAQMNDLVHATVVSALVYGHSDREPKLGSLPGSGPIEIVLTSQTGGSAIATPIVPRYAHLSVRPTQAAVQEIEDRVRRRYYMLVGEGVLLFFILTVCSFMLYRLVDEERRNIDRIREFFSTVTHEMKTPLTGIKSLLQTFAAGNVPVGDQPKLFVMGLKEVERLEHQIENILISSQLREGQFEVQQERVDLPPCLDAFVEHRRRYLIDRPEAIGLVWEISASGLKVRCDPAALQVVLENLTDNAFKYGGPVPQVTLRVTRKDGRIVISVEDRGIGFPPEMAEEFFLPFRRSRAIGSAIQHGTGLGLSIARGLVARMGGTLTAASAGSGHGSQFAIALEEANS